MRYTTKLFAFLFLAIPVFTSCVFPNKPIYGNHQLVNKRININNYEKVVVNIPGEVFYQQFSDSMPYLQIHTDENIFEALDVRVQDNQLVLDVKKDSIIRPSKLTIYTCSHNLNYVSVNGSGNIRLKGEVNANEFNLNIMGSGNLLADSLLCNKLAVNITGSGNTQLTGASNQSSYTITGSGNINAFDFFVQDLQCIIIGSGDMETLVSNTLNVNITGSGDLSYRGNPKSIERKIIGSGTVKAL
jgi:hypothetical protein